MDTPLLLFISLLIYIFFLFTLKSTGYMRKISSGNCNNCCPNCDKSLERIKRNINDHFTNYLTFYIFNFKKYKCKECKWVGLRTECKKLRKQV